MRRFLLAAAAGGWLAALGAPAAPPAVAAAAEENRAAVIVDTGTQVKSVCVRFREESITGVEALARAAVDPVFRAFPGKGAAVCSLCGTGCPGDDSCLTCDGEGRFWSYSRASGGTTTLRSSGVGASSTTVRDGDVEGWRWGLGGTPPFATVAQVCGDVAPAATSTTGPAGTAPGPAPTTGPAGTAPGPAPTTGTAAPAAPPPTTAAARVPGATAAPGPLAGATTAPTTSVPPPGPTTTSSAPPPKAAGPADPTSRPDQPALALARRPQDDKRSGWAGLAGFGAVLVGLLGWSAVARRRRRAAAPSDGPRTLP